MSAFYGNIKNSNKTSLIFDKVYSSRAAMDEACKSDGIFNGRFVLIDYGQIKAFPFTRVYPTKEEFELGIKQGKYYYVDICDSKSTYGYLGYNPNNTKQYEQGHEYDLKKYSYYIKRESLLDTKTLTTPPKIIEVANNSREAYLCEYILNKEKDLEKYYETYQHTVWQKIWVQTGSSGTVEEKYICVANLDSKAPLINLIVDAPSDLDTLGYSYIPTDKNQGGYLTLTKFNQLSSSKEAQVYILGGTEDSKYFYIPAGDYDSTEQYYVVKDAGYKGQQYVYYTKIRDSYDDVTKCVQYVFPTLYQTPVEVQGITADNATQYYIQNNSDGELFYIKGMPFDPEETYYSFKLYEDEYKEGIEVYYASQANILRRFTSPSFYEVVEAPSGNDFPNGYITEELYDKTEQEMFYYNNIGAVVSVYNEIVGIPSEKDFLAGVYFKGSANNFIKKISGEKYNKEEYIEYNYIPADVDNLIFDLEKDNIWKLSNGEWQKIEKNDEYELHTQYYFKEPMVYYTKEAYDKDKRYLEFTSSGAGPHFDPLKSTDLEYQLHVPRQWKFAKEVDFDYRLEGFSPYVRPTVQMGANSITVETDYENLTTKYPVHNSDFPESAQYYQEAEGAVNNKTDWSGTNYNAYMAFEKQADTKKFNIKLPEIGEAMADMWDNIYPRGFMHQVMDESSLPTSNFDESFAKDLFLTDDGYAKYYYLAPHKNGYLSASLFKELKEAGNLFEQIAEGVYCPAYRYGYNIQYYNFTGSKYIPVETDVKIYLPIYGLEQLIALKNEEKDFYTFQAHSEGDIRVMFMGNDREPQQFYGSPYTLSETIRHAYKILGLEKDNDTIENPPYGTVYGVLNGAKTLYGDPNDKITGTYTKVEGITKDNFDKLRDSLWLYDNRNNAWTPVNKNTSIAELQIQIDDLNIKQQQELSEAESEEQENKIKEKFTAQIAFIEQKIEKILEMTYYLETQPGYQLVPTDKVDMSNGQPLVDGYISEELFNYLRTVGKWKLYTYEVDGEFKPLEDDAQYDENIQYYSNLTTLWAYLNDLKMKFPLYQADWCNNNSNSIGFIHNKPKVIIKSGEYGITSSTSRHFIIEELWNSYHAIK